MLKNSFMSVKLKNPKLLVELIPKTCQWSSVRTTVTTSEWDKIRTLSYAAANHKCEICSNTGKKQGYKHDVECHEIWNYDDLNHIQKLVGLISLCPTCHQVKHIGRAIVIGKEKDCHKQLIKVNSWTQEQVNEHILESFKLHKERSKYKWLLDISLLEKEPYNIKLKPMKERIFEVKKYKKKKKVAGAKKRIHPKAKLAAALKPKSTANKKPPKK